jgi:hypothetical protein
MIFRSSIQLLLATGVLAGAKLVAEPTPFSLATWAKPVPRHSVLAEDGYYVWGGSVVEDGGKYHMFYSRWPTSPWTFGDGWLFASEICHAVADTPAGPFTPTGVVLGKRADDPEFAFWDSKTQHNPHIQKSGGKFHLYYMASVDPGAAVWPGISERNRIQRNQRIGVISTASIQDLLDGRFTRPDEPLVAPVYSTSAATDRITNPTDFASNRIVNNPSVTRRPDGKYQLICKSNWPQAPGYGHGIALADDPAGPFTQIPGPVFSDEGREDENHWYDAARNRYFLLIKNFGRGGTEQLESADGSVWTSQGIQLGRAVQWEDGAIEPLEALERPQILRNAAGDPVMLYMAARRALAGGAKEAFNVHIPLSPPKLKASALLGVDAIATSGLPVLAVNLGATTPVTLNGLSFTPAGTAALAIATSYGFAQAGGASGAALSTGLVDAAYEGIAEFEDFLDTMAWQTQSVVAGATLSFSLGGLTPGRVYRLQLFLAESRSGSSARHGPQSLSIAGETYGVFDVGPASSLVAAGATAIRLEATFTAAGEVAPVTLAQQVAEGGGLQLAAFALHDVSPPPTGRIEMPAGGSPMLSWQVVPGFNYSVWRSPDLNDWQPAATGTFSPMGGGLIEIRYIDSAPPPHQAFYRLVREN